MIELHVTEPSSVPLRYVEAAIKPEQVKDVTPLYEPQTVLPDAGMTLSRVNVGAIPDPTDVKNISENGDHDVRRYGTARVNVQPKLQSRNVTPTEQTQTVTPDSGFDGLESVEVNPIPSEYIVPSGSLDITENENGIDVKDKVSVNVNVPIEISGPIFRVLKTRVTYAGDDRTDISYNAAVNYIKTYITTSYGIIAGFEVLSGYSEDGDWVAGSGGIDDYSSRAYYWVLQNGVVKKSYTNYWQYAKGNLKNGMIIDVYSLQLI